MSRSYRRFALALLLVPASAPAQDRPATPAAKAEEPKVEVRTDLPALIEAHNRERSEAGLGPLKPDPKLTDAAAVHARDMAAHQKMAHEGSDGSTPAERIKQQGYQGKRTGENVAYGQRTVDEVMTAWMNSPDHKHNILGDFEEIGVAEGHTADGVPYWAVEFGTPWPRLEPEQAAANLLDAVNAARKEAGKPPVQADPKLAAAAQRHAGDMAEAGELKANDADGLSPFDRLRKQNARFQALAISDASGVAEAAGLVEDWQKDDDRKAQLTGNFSRIGVGYAVGKGGKPYWSVIFGQPFRR